MRYDETGVPPSGDSMGNSDSSQPTAEKTKKAETTKPQMHRCSYCSTSFERGESKTMPFCSKRCQQIDLGMWLTESYGMPYEGESSLDYFRAEEKDDEDE